MCFTININTTRNAIEERFKVNTSALSDFQYHFFYRAFNNPSIPVVTQEQPDRVQLLHWGLIPHWVRNYENALKIRTGTYNARIESVEEKPAFKHALSNGRCWIIAKGFYEWQHLGKDKIPWYISTANNDLFAFAGLYESWTNPNNGEELKTFSIITTKANPLMEKIHNTKKRMPLILNEKNELKWLDHSMSAGDAYRIISTNQELLLNAYTISKDISKPDTDPNDPEILRKIDYYTDGNLF